MANDQVDKFGVWKYILIPILLVVIPLLFNKYFKEDKVATPKFLIHNPIVDSVNTVLKVELLNSKVFSEEERQILLFEINGLLFSTQNAGNKDNDSKVIWLIDFKQISAPSNFFNVGTNIITLRLIENDKSSEMKFLIKDQIKTSPLRQAEKKNKTTQKGNAAVTSSSKVNNVNWDSLEITKAKIITDDQLSYYVITGSFLMIDRAKSNIMGLSKEGLSLSICQFPNSSFFSVIAGEFSNRVDADVYLRSLHEKNIDGFIRAAPKGLKCIQ